MLALVFLHYGGVYGSDVSPFRGYVGQELPVASILISFILFVGFTAVPAMSAISGYLFFQGASRDNPPDFMRKIGRRATSLALPFLIWSTFFAAAAFLVHLRWPGMFANDFSTVHRGTLRIVADVCRQSVRDLDTIGRYGGEEFAVLLPHADTEQGAGVAERMRAAIEAIRIRTPNGNVVEVTISMGIATVDASAVDLHRFLHNAVATP